jgi:hypothetical protein
LTREGIRQENFKYKLFQIISWRARVQEVQQEAEAMAALRQEREVIAGAEQPKEVIALWLAVMAKAISQAA